jgi:hypothetical protein
MHFIPITSILKVSTYIIIAHPIGLVVTLAIMSVSTFKTAVIIYISCTNKFTNLVAYFPRLFSSHFVLPPPKLAFAVFLSP